MATVVIKLHQHNLLSIALLWLVFFLCATPGARGLDPTRRITQYGHTAWRVQDGIVARSAAITQSTDGYVWLAVSGGLMRFDGVRFVPWQPPEGQKLPSRRS